MKEKIDFSDKFITRQEPWAESPCSQCSEIHCCKNMPLAVLRLENRSDFINLILTSSYDGILPVLKDTGEWNFYLKRDCRYLSKTDGRCKIHKDSDQSLICKSYNAHTCWYIEAFSPEIFSTMIQFNTEMIIWYEKKYKLIEKRFCTEINWKELCSAAYDYKLKMNDIKPNDYQPYKSFKLSFKNSKKDQFLFLPPYKLPKNRNHFELLSFRLSFPGIYLAITDTCWAFMVRTNLNQEELKLIRNDYPAIEHKDGLYSFDSVLNICRPYSELGEQWITLHRSDLKVLKNLTIFDTMDRVKKLPSSSDILSAIKSQNTEPSAS